MKVLPWFCTGMCGSLLLAPGAGTAQAQGTVAFATKITGTLDARVMLSDGTPATSVYLGQLYAGSMPLGSPVAFRDSPVIAQGYITAGGTLAVPGVSQGDRTEIQLVAWHSAYGLSYGDAVTRSDLFGGVGIGESAPVSVMLGGGLIPPVNLVGLQGFTMTVVPPETVAELHRIYGAPGGGGINIPEPTMALLAGVGGWILLLGRRDRR